MMEGPLFGHFLVAAQKSSSSNLRVRVILPSGLQLHGREWRFLIGRTRVTSEVKNTEEGGGEVVHPISVQKMTNSFPIHSLIESFIISVLGKFQMMPDFKIREIAT